MMPAAQPAAAVARNSVPALLQPQQQQAPAQQPQQHQQQQPLLAQFVSPRTPLTARKAAQPQQMPGSNSKSSRMASLAKHSLTTLLTADASCTRPLTLRQSLTKLFVQ